MTSSRKCPFAAEPFIKMNWTCPLLWNHRLGDHWMPFLIIWSERRLLRFVSDLFTGVLPFVNNLPHQMSEEVRNFEHHNVVWADDNGLIASPFLLQETFDVLSLVRCSLFPCCEGYDCFVHSKLCTLDTKRAFSTHWGVLAHHKIAKQKCENARANEKWKCSEGFRNQISR